MHDETFIIIATVIGVAIVLSAVIFVFGRLKIEHQRTLQKLLEQKDASTRPEWSELVGNVSRRESDFRRGVLLIVLGIALTVVLLLTGGMGWIVGLLPVTVGLVYLFFWIRNGDSR